MAVVWCVHNDQNSLDLIGEGFICIGWDDLGDLSQLDPDRDQLKQRLASAYPEAKPRAIPAWAGIIYRFIHEMQVGHFVISPRKDDRTLSFGVIDSDFYIEQDVDLYRNRRRVRWNETGVPRDEFSRNALNEIGSALTLFKVKSNAEEFLRYFSVSTEPRPQPVESDFDVEPAESEPTAERVETYSRDFVVDVLRHMDPYRFEHFIAGLLEAMGYRASATVASGDGGVDIIASRDPLSIEPPIIKVQCKRTTAKIGSPDVQRLLGALAEGRSEVGLFVTLGAYSAEALNLERTRQNLRLVNGKQLVDLLFEYYEALDTEWQRLILLRKVFAVDQGESD